MNGAWKYFEQLGKAGLEWLAWAMPIALEWVAYFYLRSIDWLTVMFGFGEGARLLVFMLGVPFGLVLVLVAWRLVYVIWHFRQVRAEWQRYNKVVRWKHERREHRLALVKAAKLEAKERKKQKRQFEAEERAHEKAQMRNRERRVAMG